MVAKSTQELTVEAGPGSGCSPARFLPVQLDTGAAMARHKGVTWASPAEPGYGRTLVVKLGLFAHRRGPGPRCRLPGVVLLAPGPAGQHEGPLGAR
ncbi:hypothetical protein ABZ759_22735 [Streptomyces sp. NPDC047860]|uniref:hypothetical protein n=1 Tax=Streptomyces sp. NPDC047860 TaxID=3155743 RepID=UPI0033E609DD